MKRDCWPRAIAITRKSLAQKGLQRAPSHDDRPALTGTQGTSCRVTQTCHCDRSASGLDGRPALTKRDLRVRFPAGAPHPRCRVVDGWSTIVEGDPVPAGSYAVTPFDARAVQPLASRPTTRGLSAEFNDRASRSDCPQLWRLPSLTRGVPRSPVRGGWSGGFMSTSKEGVHETPQGVYMKPFAEGGGESLTRLPSPEMHKSHSFQCATWPPSAWRATARCGCWLPTGARRPSTPR
jgi:hypothetical protein